MSREPIPSDDFSPIEAALRALRAPAPPRVASSTLVSIGLADEYAVLATTGIGPVYLVWNGRGVSAVMREESAEAVEVRFRAAMGRPLHRVAAPPPDLLRAVERRLSGDRRARVPLDLRGTSEFQQAVWLKALEIPRGELRPYAWIAREIGRPKAVRAVGSALGRNPVPLIVPCHRVVKSDGHLGQYSLGGPEVKRAVLAAEGLDLESVEGLANAGVRFVGSDTTHIVCLPTCHNAKRITDRHRISFHSIAESAQAGYRPCLECRPASAA